MLNQRYPFVLRPLPYPYYALEPYIDRETLYFHHDKHQQAYVDNLNKALESYPEYQKYTLIELLEQEKMLPKEIQKSVHNNGGGVFNHNLYFDSMSPKSSGTPSGTLAAGIYKKYGSYDKFKERFKKTALEVFGSGYAWLMSDLQGDLIMLSAMNQDVPLELNLNPILLLDVWEHAYYLKYQNRRADYIDNWFLVIDWEKAENRYRNPEAIR